MPNNNHSYYHDLRGEYVIVYTKSTSFHGFLEDDNHDTLTLRPSLVNEPLVGIEKGEVQSSLNFRLEEKRPFKINTMDVQAVAPTTKEHIDHLVSVSKKFREICLDRISDLEREV